MYDSFMSSFKVCKCHQEAMLKSNNSKGLKGMVRLKICNSSNSRGHQPQSFLTIGAVMFDNDSDSPGIMQDQSILLFNYLLILNNKGTSLLHPLCKQKNAITPQACYRLSVQDVAFYVSLSSMRCIERCKWQENTWMEFCEARNECLLS
jgi:hypothetical protein